MRYADRITLYKYQGHEYNPQTGKTEIKISDGVTKACNLSPLSLEKTNMMFGDINTKVTIARLQRQYNSDADLAMIDNQKYRIKRHIPYDKESVFYIEGVTSWT